jgi:hypothetical protein
MFDHWDHPLWFGKQNEVAGVGDHSELGIGDNLECLKRVFNLNKIRISLSAVCHGLPGIFGFSHASNTSPGGAGMVR